MSGLQKWEDDVAKGNSECLVMLVFAVLAGFGGMEARADSFDWRDVDGKNFMTPAKAQGSLECRQFAGIAAIEAKIKIFTNNPDLDIDLSERQVITQAFGTSGFGLFCGAGILAEADMPYDSPAVFPPNWQNQTYKIVGENSVPMFKEVISDEAAMRTTIQGWLRQYGPMYTEDYHGNTLVGYNDDGGYWIFKETYGASAGDDGYFYYPYGYMEDRFVLVLTNDPIYYGDTLLPEPMAIGMMMMGGLALLRRKRTGENHWKMRC